MTELERLLAERACQRVVIESAVANDERRWSDLAALYTADGVVVRPNGQRLEGRRAIEAAYAGGPPDRVTRHLCANVRVDLEGPDAAWVTTAVLILTVAPGTTTVTDTKVGEFADLLVRTPEGWRIAERRATLAATTSPD